MLIEGTRSDDASTTPIPVSRDQLSSLIEDKVTETLKRTLPDILRNAFMTPESMVLKKISLWNNHNTKEPK